ncbi:helix-turn-helix transcriptional regulator [Rhodobacterales bacterium 52_120_T64]|nr:helix-turn-helix transcriptional regulator [Rhodobacterales bacterium 52_120_T64]
MDSFKKIAFEQAPIGIVLTENRVIKACNKTFEDLFGYSREELINQSFRMLYQTRREFDEIRDIGLEPLRETGSYTDERLMLHRDGSMFWCRFRAHTMTQDNPLGQAILTFADISEMHQSISLTPRERQVVMLLRKGQTSKEIARSLSISPRTVEDYRATLLAKFKVKNVAELLAHIVGTGQP